MAKRQRLERWWDVVALPLPPQTRLQWHSRAARGDTDADAAELLLRLTYTELGGGNSEPLRFPDGFAAYSAADAHDAHAAEVARLACDVLSLCPQHGCCLEALPPLYRLRWHAEPPAIAVQLDLDALEAALRSGAPAALGDAQRVLPLLMHRLALGCRVRLGEPRASATLRCFPHALHREQRQLAAALRAVAAQREHAQAPIHVLPLGDSGFYADLAAQRLVAAPALAPTPLRCDGGVLWAPRGAGRKRALLAHLFSAPAAREATPQERELLLCCAEQCCVVAAGAAQCAAWRREAEALGLRVLALTGCRAWRAATFGQLLAAQLCVVAAPLLTDLRYWALDARLAAWDAAGVRRADIVLHLQRSGARERLLAHAPLLELVRWRGLVWAEPIKSAIARRFAAAERWVLLAPAAGREPDLLALHRAYKLLGAECEAPCDFHSFGAQHGLAWAPSLPRVAARRRGLRLAPRAQAWCVEQAALAERELHEALIALPALLAAPLRGALLARGAAADAALADNAQRGVELDALAARLRAEQATLHGELANELAPDDWDAARHGDWALVRDAVLQQELDRVEAALAHARRERAALGAVQRAHLDAALRDACPVCLEADRTAALLRCGHALCWLCARRLLADAALRDLRDLRDPQCPQCRAPLSLDDLWLVAPAGAADKEPSKLDALIELIRADPSDPPLVLVNSEISCRAVQRALRSARLAVQRLRGSAAALRKAQAYVGCADELLDAHLPLRHLVLMHSALPPLQHLICHAGQPMDAALLETTLFYDDLE